MTHTVPRVPRVLILKRAVFMFIQRSQTPQINQCIKEMYIEISEMCLKIILPLLKKIISRYILILNYCPALR